jgi:predicted PurR-regulated permease PerM
MLGLEPKAAHAAWTYAVVGLLFIAAYLVRKTLLAFAIALLLAYLLVPFVDFLQRRLPWKSRALAVSIPFAVILTLLSVFMLVVAPQLRDETRLLVAGPKALTS